MIKRHPGFWMLLLAFLSGQFWAFQMESPIGATSQMIVSLFGIALIIVTIFPSAFFVCVLWATLDWWDEAD